MTIDTILCCYIADEEMFPLEKRFADGGLKSSLQRAAQKHASKKTTPEQKYEVKSSSGEQSTASSLTVSKAENAPIKHVVVNVHASQPHHHPEGDVLL